MDQIGGKILLFVALAFLFVTVIVGIVYPMVNDKTNDVKTTIDGTQTGYILHVENHPTLNA